MSRFPWRRLNSSVNAYWRRGSAPGLVRHVADDLPHEPRLQVDPDGARRCCDRLGKPLLGRRAHRDQPGTHQIAELGVLERPVEEVGAHGENDAHPAPLVCGDGHQAVEKEPACLLGPDGGEQLLELVDHEEQTAVVGREDLLGDPQQPALIRNQLVDALGWSLHGHPHQSRFQLLERVGTGEHVGDQPVLRAKPTCPQGGDETGTHHRGLAASGRSYHGNHRVGADCPEQLVDQHVAPVEVEGIGLGEGAQALVWVANSPTRRCCIVGLRDRHHVGANGTSHGTQEVLSLFVPVPRPIVGSPAQHCIEF